MYVEGGSGRGKATSMQPPSQLHNKVFKYLCKKFGSIMIVKSSLMKNNDTCYISCGCNRTPHCMDWGENDLVCYGTCNSVAIYDTKENGGGRVIVTLSGHKNRVNAVRWIRGESSRSGQELISVSTDKTAIVWTLKDGEFHQSAQLSGHSDSVTLVDAMYHRSDPENEHPHTIVATASVDSSIKLWSRQDSDDFSLMYTIDLKLGISLALVFMELPGYDSPLLVTGNDDSKVYIYSETKKLVCLEGHEDWIRSVDSTIDEKGDVLLASSSQDAMIRLWRFNKKSSQIEIENKEFKQEEQSFEIGERKWAVTLESILYGHEGWVYSVQWNPMLKKGGSWTDPAGQLLSCSLDRTLVLWSQDPGSGVWLEQARMGELGGNTLGYYGAKFSPDGHSVLGHSFQGSFRLWHNCEDGWRPGVTVGGHFNSVEEIGWESKGRYLLSVSLDQTTRLHAPWTADPTNTEWSWHELSRPQIHGYDLYCLAVLPNNRFVSGAEEKVSRVFVAPQNTLENLSILSELPLEESLNYDRESVPYGAAVPALGLSNKAVYEDNDCFSDDDSHNVDDYSSSAFFAQHLNKPGTEDYLSQNSLWPEEMKLYGHGYEIFSLAASHNGDLLASACKASSQQHAKIILWNTKNWRKLQELEGHQLTVTQMAFSPDDTRLLSVSRDRRWCLFEQQEDKCFKLVGMTDKATGIHTRIIWTCCWSHDSEHFATGSREGRLVVWGKSTDTGKSTGEYGAVGTPLQVQDSITAVSFAPGLVLKESTSYLLAVGAETGWIHCYSWSKEAQQPWQICYKIQKNLDHHLTVKKLAFRPVLGKTGDYEERTNNILQLASCSQDHSVRIHNINLDSIAL